MNSGIQSLSWSGSEPVKQDGITLAGPHPNSTPRLDLRFEELPGATGFADSSLFNNTTTCSRLSCPSAGGRGAQYANGSSVGIQASDYALDFRPNQSLRVGTSARFGFAADQSFTLSVWAKTTVGGVLLWKGTAGGNGVRMQINSKGQVEYRLDNPTTTAYSAGPDLRDNRWHHLAVTVNRSTKRADLFVDGVPYNGNAITGSFSSNTDLMIGSDGTSGFTGSLDEVKIFESALALDAIQALYNGTLQSYAMAAVPRDTSVSWTKLGLRPRDVRGAKVSGTGHTSITIDADGPTARVTSLRDGQYVKVDPRTSLVMISGTATDPTSSVTGVEITSNRGPGHPTGAASWSSLQLIEPGTTTIQVRAIDAVGNVGAYSAPITVYGDRFPPVMTHTQPAGSVVPFRRADGSWIVRLQGTVTDPKLEDGHAGSGVDVNSVEIQLARPHPQGAHPGINWQRARVDGNTWRIDYVFPADQVDPTPKGYFEVLMRSKDNVGNDMSGGDPRLLDYNYISGNGISVDTDGPDALLTKTDTARQAFTGAISDTMTISGVISDTGGSGIQALDVNFAPIQQTAPFSDALLMLKLDEPAGTGMFQDSSGYARNAVCLSSGTCVLAGVPGRIDGAVQVSGRLLIPAEKLTGLDFTSAGSFSLQTWVRIDPNKPFSYAEQSLIDMRMAGVGQVKLGLKTGYGASPSFFVVGSSGQGGDISRSTNLKDGKWHFLVGTVDRATNTANLFVDGNLAGSHPIAGSFLPTTFQIGSSNFNDVPLDIDQVGLYNHALLAVEVQQLYNAADRAWKPATVAQPGATTTTWSLPVPGGLEGSYQIELRATDAAGNRRLSGNGWRGSIDTRAPRVSFGGFASGASYVDPSTNLRRYEIVYTCTAEDFFLSPASFICPGNELQPATRTINSDPILKKLFPDLTFVTKMTNTYSRWEPNSTPTGSMRACDTFNHCVSATAHTALRLTDIVPSGSDSILKRFTSATAQDGPRSVIISPSFHSVVGTTGDIMVTIAAEATHPLRDVTLTLDDAVVARLTWAQSENMMHVVRTVPVTTSLRQHRLAVVATDWNGNVQQQPFDDIFTLDNRAPEVTLDTNITRQDTYQMHSGIIRFHGTVADEGGVQAVQLRVDEQGWAEATVTDGQWRVAYPVLDADETTHTVTVRAVNRAGLHTEVTKPVTIHLSGEHAPDTLLLSSPPTSTDTDTATFSFEGIDDGHSVAEFDCKLDDQHYVPCTSPVAYTSIANGEHTFLVRAIDSIGEVDPSPATFTWTQHVDAGATVLVSTPELTTTSRVASFTFTSPDAVGYVCSLDEGTYAPCARPQVYTGLRDGHHTFAVRTIDADQHTGVVTSYRWVILNAPPIAHSETVTTTVDITIPITLVAEDEDLIHYRLLTEPRHGVLLGIGPDLQYEPDTGFVGTDSFTFIASDGDLDSEPVKVLINVRSPSGQTHIFLPFVRSQ